MAQQLLEPTNFVRIVGVLAAEPSTRELPDGRTVTQWRMKVSVPGEVATSVPCTSGNPNIQKKLSALAVGTSLLIEGSVASRFWVTAGQTGSRVEIQVTHAEKCKLNA